VGPDGESLKDDDEVFAALYPSLRRFAAVVRPAEEDADDLVQDALARTLALGPLSARENPGAYLRRTIVRIASNHRRRLARGRRALLKVQPLVEGAYTATYPSALVELRHLAPLDCAVLFSPSLSSVRTVRLRRFLAAVSRRHEHARRGRFANFAPYCNRTTEAPMPELRELLERLGEGDGVGAAEVMRRARLTLEDRRQRHRRRVLPRAAAASLVAFSVIAVSVVTVVLVRTSSPGDRDRVTVTRKHPPRLFSPSKVAETPMFLVPSQAPPGFEPVQVSGGDHPGSVGSAAGSQEWDRIQRWVKLDSSRTRPLEVLDVQWGKGAAARPALPGLPEGPRPSDPLQAFRDVDSVSVTVRGHRGVYSKANGWLAWEEPKYHVVLVTGGSTVPPYERRTFSLQILRAVAEGLRARPDGSFTVTETPPDFQLAAEWPGFAPEGTNPRAVIYQAPDGRGFQVHVVDDTQEPPGINLYVSVARLTQIRGHDAVDSPFLFHAPGGFNQRTLFMQGANRFVQWLEPGNVRVTISSVGLTDSEILEVANSLQSVDQQTWDALKAQAA
jgi:DNA-directed RNA polymerase specialized sigma24 family protein